MDPLSALLDGGVRPSVIRVGDAPWSVRLAPSQQLTVVAVSDGEAWCHREDADPLHLVGGDLMVLGAGSGGARFLSCSPARPVQPLRSTSADGRGVEVWGEDQGGDTRLYVRTGAGDASAAAAMFTTWQSEYVLTTARDSALWSILREESEHLSVATSSVIARLVDLLFIDAVRSWTTGPDADGWMRAVLDPIVGATLRLFHDSPQHPWTLQEVADRVGVSRTSLSRRFQILVGEPPLTYLREWRLTCSATLLAQEDVSVATAARRSGFADPFRFSAAFSKKYGVPPSRYRNGGASAGSA